MHGCKFYYKVQTVKPVVTDSFIQYDSLNKYLILHQGDSVWHLSKYEVRGNILSGKLEALPYYRLDYQTTDPDKFNQYKHENQINVLHQVHFYIQDSIPPKFHAGDDIYIALSSLNKAEVYQKAKGKTAVSWLWPLSPLILLGAFITVGALMGIGGVSMM